MSANGASHRPEHVGDGTPPQGQDGPDDQRKNPLEGWLSEINRLASSA